MSVIDNERPEVDRESTALWAFEPGEHDTIGLRSLGFWLYMMSDVMIFAGLFVAHGVYTRAFADGPTAAQVIEPVAALWPTGLILASVFAYGLAMVALKDARSAGVMAWLGTALALGAGFLGLEAWSFTDLALRGGLPQVSAFLSDFWVLVWAHGAHVVFGLLWMVVMLVQIPLYGLNEHVIARLVNLRIFWFFQAVIWVCVYLVVYLQGASV